MSDAVLLQSLYTVRSLDKVTAPLKVEYPEQLALLLIMLKVFPLLPDATVIGLAKVNVLVKSNVASAVPLVSPMVMTLASAPKALALV